MTGLTAEYLMLFLRADGGELSCMGHLVLPFWLVLGLVCAIHTKREC